MFLNFDFLTESVNLTKRRYNVWVVQTGEPVQTDDNDLRPMRAINLSEKLVEDEHTTTVLTSNFFHQVKSHRFDSDKIKVVGEKLAIRFFHSPGYSKNVGLQRLWDHLILALNLKKFLKQTHRQLPDAIFCGYPPIEVAFVTLSWARKRNIPVVLDVKDQWPHLFLEAFPEFLKPMARVLLAPYFWAAKKTFRQASAISTPSVSYQGWINKFSKRKPSAFDLVAPLAPKQRVISVEESQKSKSFG